MKWEYGGVYKNYDMTGEIEIGTGVVKVHDIFDPLPTFMLRADCLFVDPPWNLSNLNTFYTKADQIDQHHDSFKKFYLRLLECVGEIAPKTLYLEVGKQYLADFIMEARKQFRHVTFYNSMYYRKRENKCYIIRATQGKKRSLSLDYMDEEDIIKWVCENEEFDCIGDLCMGQGLVGYYAFKNGREFVGTELNNKRLAVLLDRINKEAI